MIAKKKMEPDVIIIGAGLSGCTIANVMAENGWNVLLLEKNNKIGGSCSDTPMDNYYVCEHGPHVFHTSNDDLWAFVNEFANFNNFVNTPLVKAEGSDELFNLPFNMNMFSRFFNEYNPSNIEKIITNDIEQSILKYNIDVNNKTNLEEHAISIIGEKIYNAFIKHYNEKQWGKSCTELDPHIIKRLPIRFSYNNNYFRDQYQGCPIDGYSKMMEEMIHDRKIQVRLNVDFKDHQSTILNYINIKNIPLVYTGAIDELFDYKYGELEWRTVRFESELLYEPNHQGVAVINYADKDTKHLRSIEHKHFYCINNQDIYYSNRTIVTKEFPEKWEPGKNKYYPVYNEKNFEILQKYQEEAMNNDNLYLLGRLAEYRYKDMAPSIDDAIKMAWEILNDFSKH